MPAQAGIQGSLVVDSRLRWSDGSIDLSSYVIISSFYQRQKSFMKESLSITVCSSYSSSGLSEVWSP